eukprot:1156043-Pelagomonas_calceolata.AAC.29
MDCHGEEPRTRQAHSSLLCSMLQAMRSRHPVKPTMKLEQAMHNMHWTKRSMPHLLLAPGALDMHQVHALLHAKT